MIFIGLGHTCMALCYFRTSLHLQKNLPNKKCGIISGHIFKVKVYYTSERAYPWHANHTNHNKIWNITAYLKKQAHPCLTRIKFWLHEIAERCIKKNKIYLTYRNRSNKPLIMTALCSKRGCIMPTFSQISEHIYFLKISPSYENRSFQK
jgi:hypothetical protein